MRVMLIFLVVFGHSGEAGMDLYRTYEHPSLPYVVYIVAHYITSCSVYAFFFLSGALLLGRQESVITIFKKRFLRIVAALILFSIPAYLQRSLTVGYDAPPSFTDFLKRLAGGQVLLPYWYLYMYLAFLIALPFLRALAQNLKNRDFEYLLQIGLFFGLLIPFLKPLLGRIGVQINNDLIPGWLLQSIVLLPLAGYYLEERCTVEDLRRRFGRLTILFIGGMALSSASIHLDHRAGDSRTLIVLAPFLFCVFFYSLFRILTESFPPSVRVQNFITQFSSLSFGIYLIHILIMNLPGPDRLTPLFKYTLGIPSLLSAMLSTFMITVLSAVVVRLLRELPVLKHLL